jgi:uncharacterized protein YjhX (UPF0386 family)
MQYFAMIEDITEKKNADFKRIESENRLSFLILNCKLELFWKMKIKSSIGKSKNSVHV